MNKKLLIVLATLFVGAGLASESAQAGNPLNGWAPSRAAGEPWHGNYYYLPYGHPTALVVPPRVHTRQTYSWGVSQNLNHPVVHQFGRNASSPGAMPPGSFRATPHWPSHTDQFGLYYVRAPW